MVEPESTTAGLLSVSRTTLVNVETAKTEDEAGFILVAPARGGVVEGEAGWTVVERIVAREAAAELAARELLTPATANVEATLDISEATFEELDNSAVNVVGHG